METWRWPDGTDEMPCHVPRPLGGPRRSRGHDIHGGIAALHGKSVILGVGSAQQGMDDPGRPLSGAIQVPKGTVTQSKLHLLTYLDTCFLFSKLFALVTDKFLIHACDFGSVRLAVGWECPCNAILSSFALHLFTPSLSPSTALFCFSLENTHLCR